MISGPVLYTGWRVALFWLRILFRVARDRRDRQVGELPKAPDNSGYAGRNPGGIHARERRGGRKTLRDRPLNRFASADCALAHHGLSMRRDRGAVRICNACR